MRRLPTWGSIFWTDTLCYPVVTSASMVLFVTSMVKVTGTVPGRRGGPDRPVTPEAANWILAGGIVLALILMAIAVLRVMRVRHLFDAGEEVEATVKKVSRFRGGSALRLEFRHGGATCQARSRFLRWLRTPDFVEGMQVRLLVDPSNPRRVVPVALYETRKSA